jgi:hypothetical protein
MDKETILQNMYSSGDSNLINQKLFDSLLDKNMNGIENKSTKNMYYMASKIIMEFVEILNKNDFNIPKKIVNDYIIKNCITSINKYNNSVKKRNRKKLSNDLRCMGRKIDGKQCTRRKKTGCEYCQSHIKKLTNGRIDQEFDISKKKNKRGRKRKIEFDPRAYDSEYVTLWEDIVNDEKVLIDINNNVYTFNVTTPKYLGKKSLDGTLITPDKLKVK